MDKKVEGYLNQINEYNHKISTTEKRISEELDKFYREIINPLREDISMYNRKLIDIKNTNITANFGDIIKHYTKLTGIRKQNIDLSYYTSFHIITSSHYFASANLEKFNSQKDKSKTVLEINLQLQDKTSPESKNVTLSSSMPLCSMQRDGRTLGQHVTAHKINNDDNTYTVELNIDNPEDLILTFNLSTLIKHTPNGTQPKDDISMAILNAGEDYCMIKSELDENNIC